MRRVVLLVNPWAGGGRALRLASQVRDLFHALGWWAFIAVPPRREGTTLVARTAARARVDQVLVLAGDGTLRWVAAGLQGSSVPLAVLPTGTANVMARYLGTALPHFSPARLESLIHQLIQARPRTWDVLQVNQTRALLWCGWGLDAHLVHQVEPRRRRTGGEGRFRVWVRYLVTLLRSLPRWKPQPLTLQAPGEETRNLPPSRFWVLANLPLYAGGWLRFPQGDPSDGQGELWGLPAGFWFAQAAQLLTSLPRGWPLVWPWPGAHLPTQVELRLPQPWPLHCDGDPLPPTQRVTVQWHPKTLWVLSVRD